MTGWQHSPYHDPAMATAFAEFAADNAYNAHYDRPAVLQLLGDVTGLRILDAGCGPGLYAEELVRRGAEVVGVDGSAAMLGLARERLGSGVLLLQAALGARLPFDDGTFDRVVCALAIHHADDRHAVFVEFHRLLRSTGRAVVSTSHPMGDWIRKGGSYFDVRLESDVFRLDGRGEWVIPFWRESLESLAAAATTAGFHIERIVEPRPTAAIAERWPEHYERLSRQPDFLVLGLIKP